jgi:hypothetical protein
LAIIIIIIILKKDENREKKKTTGWPRGGSGHPIFGHGATPTAGLDHPQKPKTHFNPFFGFFFFFFFPPFGVVRPPPPKA